MIRSFNQFSLVCFLGQFIACNTIDKSSNATPERGSEEAKGLYIYNGDEAPEFRKSVFRIDTLDGRVGTGFSMIRPRCIWTAGHVLDGSSAVITTDPIGLSNMHAYVISQKNFYHTPNPGVDDQNPYPEGSFESHDLGILWTKVAPGNPALLQETDYQPLALGSAEDLNFESKLLDFRIFPFSLNPKVLDVYGFGADENQNRGILKKGKVDAHAIHRGDTPVQNLYFHGSLIRALPHDDGVSVTSNCPGDSGGPALLNGKVVGVVRAWDRDGETCIPSSHFLTGIEQGDDSRLVAPSSTKYMMRFESERVCAKHLTISHVDQDAVEVVTKFVVSPPQIAEFDHDPGLNNSINCGNNDCIEHLHPGQTITIEAKIIKAGYEFEMWENNIECPCAGSTNPICVVSYASILDTWEQNRALCVPVPIQSLPTPGDGM